MASQPPNKIKLARVKKEVYDGVIATVAEAARIHRVREWVPRARLKGICPNSSCLVYGKRLSYSREMGLLLNLR